MTKNIDSKKIELIEQIGSISTEEELDQLAQYLKLARLKGKHGDVFGNMRKTISLAELKAEQGNKKFNRDKFDKIVAELDIQESIEELLSMLD